MIEAAWASASVMILFASRSALARMVSMSFWRSAVIWSNTLWRLVSGSDRRRIRTFSTSIP